ncbi:hypothetical protein Tco_1184046 [Tanacetum coccineum]
MDLIQVNMPVLVDGTHVCIRIPEMVGECDEICKPETLDESQADSDSVTTHGSDDNENTSNGDKDNINGVNHGDNENVDDFLDDGFEDGSNCSNMFFIDKEDAYQNGGGWIRERQTSSMTQSKLRNISVTSLDAFVPDSYIKDLSPNFRKGYEIKQGGTVDHDILKIPDKFPLSDHVHTPSSPIVFHEPTTHPTQCPLNSPSLGVCSPTHILNDPIKPRPKHPQPSINKSKKTKFSSLKLIDSIHGIQTFRRNSKKIITCPSNVDVLSETSISNNESNILRCNRRTLLNYKPSPPTNCDDIAHEVLKTIEIGSIVGYSMNGKEADVHALMGENVVEQ